MRTTTIDPHAENYYSISPYAWCANNPVRMVDLDGRDVTLSGYDTKAFEKSLQQRAGSAVTITLNDNGYLSYEVNDNDNISEYAQMLMTVIDDRNIQVNLISVKGFTTPDGKHHMDGGAFLGNTVIKDANGNVTKVIANQVINVDFMNKLDAASNNPKANGMMHEVSEAYVGAKNSFKSGESAVPVIRYNNEPIDPNSAYWQAHIAAYKQPIIDERTDGYYTTQYAPLRISISPKLDRIFEGKYYNGRRMVKFYSK
jgi:hypothetical protein